MWRGAEAFGADAWDEDGNTTTTGAAAYIGKGGYAGLRMRTLLGRGISEPGHGCLVVGWIEPAD